MKKIISIYGKNYLDSLLNNRDQLENIYDLAYQSRNGVEGANQELKNIQDAIDYYVVEMVLNNSIDSTKVANYKYVINKMFNIDVTSIYRNPLLKLPEDKISTVIDSYEYSSIERRKEYIAKKCREIYEKGENITPSESKLLFEYLESNINSRNKEVIAMEEDIFHKILVEKKDYGYKEASFVTSFIASRELKNYGIEGYCNLSSYEVASKKRLDSVGQAGVLRVNINADYAIKAITDKENLGMFIHNICYEIRHLNQIENIQKGVRNDSVLNCLSDKLMRFYLKDEEYDYYKDKYYFESGEMSAQIDGYDRAIEYLKRYGNFDEISKLSDIKNQQIYNKLLEMRNNRNDELDEKSKYKYGEIDKVIASHKSLLGIYSQLRAIYNEDGTRKSFQELLIDKGNFKKKNKKDNSDIYRSIIDVSIDQGELKNIVFSNISKENTFSMMHALTEQYNDYSISMYNYLLIVDSLNIEDQDKTYLEENVAVFGERFDQIELVLDGLYEKFADDYKQQPDYRQDFFMYQKDKMYTRYQHHKLVEKNQNRMLNNIFSNDNNNGFNSKPIKR